MLLPRVALLLFALSVNAAMAAERTEVLDLGAEATDRTVPAGEPIRVVVTNRLPQYRYVVKTRIREIEIPPLSLPPELQTRSGDLCGSLAKAFDDTLRTLTNEEDVGGQVAGFREASKACTVEQRGKLELVIADLSKPVDQIFELDPGEELVVNVERPQRSWEYVLSTGARGQWRAFYGFNFIPNNDEEYFTAQDANDPNTFIISRKTDREDWDFAPSVFFTWRPASQQGRNWGHGPTAGLGFDTSNPIVFGGWAATYNENLALTAGVVFHKQKRLDGRYEEGQSVNENLGTDQLATETYQANLYIGIAFRFGSSPFSKDSQ